MENSGRRKRKVKRSKSVALFNYSDLMGLPEKKEVLDTSESEETQGNLVKAVQYAQSLAEENEKLLDENKFVKKENEVLLEENKIYKVEKENFETQISNANRKNRELQFEYNRISTENEQLSRNVRLLQLDFKRVMENNMILREREKQFSKERQRFSRMIESGSHINTFYDELPHQRTRSTSFRTESTSTFLNQESIKRKSSSSSSGQHLGHQDQQEKPSTTTIPLSKKQELLKKRFEGYIIPSQQETSPSSSLISTLRRTSSFEKTKEVKKIQECLTSPKRNISPALSSLRHKKKRRRRKRYRNRINIEQRLRIQEDMHNLNDTMTRFQNEIKKSVCWISELVYIINEGLKSVNISAKYSIPMKLTEEDANLVVIGIQNKMFELDRKEYNEMDEKSWSQQIKEVLESFKIDKS